MKLGKFYVVPTVLGKIGARGRRLGYKPTAKW
jgi:hypothetical protein